MQPELTKFYRPITESQKATAREITESQKATAREITEGLRPIREGIENLPQAMQPIGGASGEAPEEEEEDESIGPVARHFLNKPDTDKTFGVRKIGKHHYIGNKHVIITEEDDIIIDGNRFFGSAGLWGLITTLFIEVTIRKILTQKAVKVVNGKCYSVLFGKIGKSMRERVSLSCRVILMHC